MDSITQGLLGAAVAECGFRHRLGRGATLLGLSAGVLPDLDIVAGWMNPWWQWAYHRHFTHSVFFAPLVAAPLAWLFWRRTGRKHFALWCLCAYLALATHPLLDLCTSYGTFLFVPVWGARLSLDWVGIIDPFYSLTLLVALLGCLLLRRRRRSAGTWRVGLAGVVLSTGYLLYGALQHDQAIQRIHEAAGSRGEVVRAARAVPNIGSVWVWRLVYRTDQYYYVGRTNTRFSQPPAFTQLPIEDDPLIRRADAHPRVQLFHRFCQGWARPTVHRTPEGTVVIYDDLRYGWPPDSPQGLWAVVVEFDQAGDVRSVRRSVRPARRLRPANGAAAAGFLRMVWDENGRP